MKKIFLTLMMAILGCAMAMAGSDIKLTGGSLATLKDGGIGCVVIDMTDTKFDNKMPLRQDERFANVDAQMQNYKSEFVREFNENSKKFRMTENNEDAEYEFIVKISNLDVFVNVMSFKGGVGIKLWGTIVIKNKATGDNVAYFVIDEEGNSSMTYILALEEGYEGIAKFLAKRINNGK